MLKWLRVVNIAEEKRGEIYIYGEIVSEKWFESDVSPAEVQDALALLQGVDRIDIYINSPGGNVFDGMAIHSMIKRTEAKTVAHIDGVAASIASVIAIAADEVRIPKGAWFMIHKPMIAGFWVANADDMRKEADVLDKLEEGLLATYSEKRGTSKEEIKALIDEETWMTGEEAVAFGFADVLVDGAEIKATANKSEKIATVNDVKMSYRSFKNFPIDKIACETEPAPQNVCAEREQMEAQLNSLSFTLMEVC